MSGTGAQAATVPANFTDTLVSGGLTNATAMAFAPDGRLFVCLQSGQLRVIKDGALLPTPFLTVSVDATGERGLLGIAFDPDFANNNFVYVYYTVNTSPRHNRISRFTANGDVAVAGSETLIFRLDDLSGATNHNGGAMHFGIDGKLYVAVGENANGSNAQTLSNLHGKMLRLNSDGSIPTDNPFFNQATGDERAIWALGLRNPYTFAVQRGTGRIFINDVGQNTWEEINDGIAGSNYGWPTCEGACNNANFRNPVHQYANDASTCAITGGAFYNPPVTQFPGEYVGAYFFSDFCGGYIKRLNPANNSVTDFATNISLPVDLQVGPDGSLYYLARGSSAVFKIQYTPAPPLAITTHPSSQTIREGSPVTFTVAASGTPPFTYQWQRNGADIPGANSSSYTINAVAASDSGAQFRAVVSNSQGTVTSNPATLTVTVNAPPTGTITQPTAGSFYSAGDTIAYAGTATDAEDGELPASAFTWSVEFHHDTHTHPVLAPTSGSKSGSFNIPTSGETAVNVFYRIHLKVTDSGGLIHESFRDVLPRVARLTLSTSPAGLQITLDGQPQTAPIEFDSVVGMTRTIGTVSPQTLSGTTYDFQSWSDGGALTHTITTPSSDTTFTAVFVARPVATPNTIQFSSTAYQGTEGDAGVQITVTRNGDTATPATVNYSTGDGTASQRSDYTALFGTLHFASGESSKSLTLLPTDDAYVEGDETLSISLTNVAGGSSLGSPSVATVTIRDNGETPTSENTIDDNGNFVRQHYHDFLQRQPDEQGFQFWVDQLAVCGSDAGCLDGRRQSVSAAFFLSIEFQNTGYLIHRLEKLSFDRLPRYQTFLSDLSRIKEGVIVGEDGWQARMEANRQTFTREWVQRAEFIEQFPLTLSAEQFVDKLFENSDAVPTSGERAAALAAYGGGGTEGRARALVNVADSISVFNRQYNPAFVLMQYFGYLRRNPDDLPNTDLSGYLFWLQKLDEHSRPGEDMRNDSVAFGRVRRAEMVRSFLISTEYRQRFGRP